MHVRIVWESKFSFIPVLLLFGGCCCSFYYVTTSNYLCYNLMRKLRVLIAYEPIYFPSIPLFGSTETGKWNKHLHKIGCVLFSLFFCFIFHLHLLWITLPKHLFTFFHLFFFLWWTKYRLPNGHINVAAFDRLATIVGAFTKHMTEVNANLTDAKEYEDVYRHMQTCKLLTDAGEWI